MGPLTRARPVTATPTPKAPPTPLPGLIAFLAPLLPLFRRLSTRESAERYCTGLLTDLSRKTCDGIAAAVAGTTTERLQHLLTDADWDPVALDRERVRLLVAESPAGGVLAIDDTTLPKQGEHSVGVMHQWCGELGKQANCQAVVTAEYVCGGPPPAPSLHWPVSARLFLPDAWVHDEPRRRRAHVPSSVPKLSKIEIALDLVDRAVAWGVPFRLVTADAAYGHFRDFFGGLDDRGLLYACAVKKRTSASAGPTRSAPLRRRGRHPGGVPVGSRSGTRPRSTGSTRSSPRSRPRRGRRSRGGRGRRVRSGSGSSPCGCTGGRGARRGPSTTTGRRRAPRGGSSRNGRSPATTARSGTISRTSRPRPRSGS